MHLGLTPLSHSQKVATPCTMSTYKTSLVHTSCSAASWSHASPQKLRARRLTSVKASAATDSKADVIIVGAGVAGLSCGLRLQKAGLSFSIIEASDGVGGRVRTDVVDGFRLDRGFQIFLTSYPTAQELLDYAALDLKPFYAGALVHYKGGFHRVADPLRHFVDGLLSLTNPIGSPLDKVNVGIFRAKTLLSSFQSLLAKKESTTLQRLKDSGFSDAIIDRFFRPFLGGIFFDRSLDVTSRLFEFVMRCLATGSNCLPAEGIGAAADQLAAHLPESSIRLGTRVQSVESSSDGGGSVVLADGSRLTAPRGVVVATDQPAAIQLLGKALKDSPSKEADGVGTCCLYFRAPRHPREENILYLNGDDDGIVNNLCFPATIAPSYAPPGQALVSVSTIGSFDEKSDEELAGTVKAELSSWFGADVEEWQLLRNYRIPFAQPNQVRIMVIVGSRRNNASLGFRSPIALYTPRFVSRLCSSLKSIPPTDLERSVSLGGGLYVCGDHREAATLEGALRSGQRAAEAISSRQQH